MPLGFVRKTDMRRCGSTLSLLAALAWLGPGLVSSSLEGERRVGRPTLKPGGRVGKFTLVERVQSLPASFSLPPPTVDAPHEVAVLGDGGPAAWLDVLALTDAPDANETDGLYHHRTEPKPVLLARSCNF